MIDFACKKLDLDEIIRCGLGITKTEYDLLKLMISKDWLTAQDLSKTFKISLATTQRSLKNLFEKGLLERRQQNLDKGGYLFVYKSKEKVFLKKELKKIFDGWANNVNNSLEKW